MDRSQIEKIATGGILSILGASITALNNKKDTDRIKIKNFLAGICAGSIVVIISRNITSHETVKEFAIVIFSSFVTHYWPLLELIGKILIKQKLYGLLGITSKTENDDVQDNNNGKSDRMPD